jgi:hypothetical protein
VKAAVLLGDNSCPNLLAVSLYDSKPVYFFSMVHEEIKWVECEKKVFCRETLQNESNKFLRLNINNDYNMRMHDVDSSDQLRNSYRFDHWLRQRKWWWSVFFWGIGVLMVNAYVAYVQFHLMHGKKKNEILTHYEFRYEIVCAWLDPDTYWADRYNNKRKRDTSSSMGSRGTSGCDSRETRSSLANKKKIVNDKQAPRVTNKALDPVKGALKDRLDHTKKHWPRPRKSLHVKCALHQWAGIVDRSQILLCSHCRVHLCSSCFELFHTEEDLVGNYASKHEKCCEKKPQSDGAPGEEDKYL